jgi:hypothetical protein
MNHHGMPRNQPRQKPGTLARAILPDRYDNRDMKQLMSQAQFPYVLRLPCSWHWQALHKPDYARLLAMRDPASAISHLGGQSCHQLLRDHGKCSQHMMRHQDATHHSGVPPSQVLPPMKVRSAVRSKPAIGMCQQRIQRASFHAAGQESSSAPLPSFRTATPGAHSNFTRCNPTYFRPMLSRKPVLAR